MPADNDYFVARCRPEESPRVDTFRGKHAVKMADFFVQVGRMQSRRMPKEWVYRPLKIEIEITNGCTEQCPHCGMDAQPTNTCNVLSPHVLRSLPQQLEDLGIPGISITGGEPLTAMRTLLDLLEHCRGVVDVVKLTTNAFWARSPDLALDRLRVLGTAGLAETRFFRPVLMLSIGEQRVPLCHVVNAIVAARRLYDSRTLAICVSSMSFRNGEHRLSELERCYEEATGDRFPWHDVFLTKRAYIAAGRALRDKSIPRRCIPIRKMCKERGCFRQTVGAVIVPTPLVKSDGRVFTCSVFGMPDELLLGSIYERNLKELAHVANSRPTIRALARGNLPELSAHVPEGSIEYLTVDHFHEACWHLLKRYGLHEGGRPESE